MKKYFFLILFFLSINTYASNQDSTFIKTELSGNVHEFFGKRLRYPIQLLQDDKQGQIVVDFRVNKLGRIDSLSLVSYFDKEVSNKIMRLLLSTREMWSPTIIDGEAQDFVYKLIFDYKIFSGRPSKKSASQIAINRATKMAKKEKYEKALAIMNSIIAKEPYNSSLYQKRAEIYLFLKNKIKSDSDLLLAKKIDREVVANIVMFAFKSEQRVVSRSTINRY